MSKKKTKLEKLFESEKNSKSVLPAFQDGKDDNDSIAISFQYLQDRYGIENRKLDKDKKVQLLKKLVYITKSTWSELVLHNKKGGFEMLRKTVFNNLPSVVTEDIDKLYVLRFASQKCRLVGFRQGVIYYVLYIDPDLSLYEH